MRKNPLRMDIVSRKSFPKETLLRFVVIDGDIALDKDHILPGRGCYLFKDKKSLELAIKKRLFQRHLHVSPSDALIAEMEAML